jgi:hypothetical protein
VRSPIRRFFKSGKQQSRELGRTEADSPASAIAATTDDVTM